MGPNWCQSFWLLQYIFLALADLVSCVRLDGSTLPVATMENGCRVNINELNLFSLQYQFFELSIYCLQKPKRPRSPNMNKYKVVFVDATGHMLGICPLEGEMINKYGVYYYTVGSTKVMDRNMNINQCELVLNDPLNPEHQILPRTGKTPIGIMLLFNERLQALSTLHLTKNNSTGMFIKTKLTNRMEEIMVRNLQDMYLIGSLTRFQYCDYFKKFNVKYGNYMNNILRDYQDGANSTDHSINRCGSQCSDAYSLPMNPEIFRYTLPSPNAQNNCHQSFAFVIENYQPRLKEPRLETTNNEACYMVTENSAANRLGLIATKRQYEEAFGSAAEFAGDSQIENRVFFDVSNVDRGEIETNNSVTFTEESDIMFTPCPIDQTMYEVQLESAYKYIGEDCNNFPGSKREQILNLPGKPIDLDDVLSNNVCSWFHYIFSASKFVCKLCKSVFNQKIMVANPGSKLVTKIMTTGVGATTGQNRKVINCLFITKHSQNPMHKIAVEYFRLYDRGLRGSELKLAFEAKGGEFRNFIQQTENVLVATFMAIKIGISFYNFELLLELIQNYDTGVGKLYHNRQGMVTFLKSISETLHTDMVETLKAEQREFSIIVDTSTDISGLTTFAILFQVTDENDKVVVKLYAVLHASKGESGIELFELFKNAMEADGLTEYLKERAAGFVSDGGANVSKVFKRHLQGYVQNELIIVHCFCHKLELVNKWAYTPYPYLVVIDKHVNELFTFFNTKSAKRRTVLRELALSRKEKFELKQIKTIRWINSKSRALTAIINHWKTIVDALEQISKSEDFDVHTIEKADSLIQIMKDANFIATIAFVADISAELAKASVQWQRKGNSLIGKKFMREVMKARLEVLKTNFGPFLTSYIENLEFNAPEDEGLTEVVQLEHIGLTKLKFAGVLLNEPTVSSKGNELSLKMGNYIESLLDQLENYFGEDVTDHFDKLDANQWPQMPESLEMYGNRELIECNSKLRWGFEEEDLISSWTLLKLSLVNHSDFKKQKELTPEAFWSYFLDPAQNITWSNKFKSVVRSIISVPSNSAEVERIYSLYSATKTARRYNLLPSTVNAILTIKFNGPKALQDLDTVRFTKAFLEKHSRVDDETRRSSWVSKKKTLPDLNNDDTVVEEFKESWEVMLED